MTYKNLKPKDVRPGMVQPCGEGNTRLIVAVVENEEDYSVTFLSLDKGIYTWPFLKAFTTPVFTTIVDLFSECDEHENK
jgi:hypothetical protein